MISKSLSNILYISRRFASYQRLFSKDNGLCPSHYRIISYVVRHPGCSQEELVTTSGIDKTTMTHRLNVLLEKGYIKRETSKKDGRCRTVFPTEKALSEYPGIRVRYDRFKTEILKGLSEEEIKTLEFLTDKLRQNAEEMSFERLSEQCLKEAGQ